MVAWEFSFPWRIRKVDGENEIVLDGVALWYIASESSVLALLDMLPVYG
jgi:hypothetical protein